MTLRSVRLDVDTPLNLVEAFQGVGLNGKFDHGEPEVAYVDGSTCGFMFDPVTQPVGTTREDENYVYTDRVFGSGVIYGPYENPIAYTIVVTTAVDKIYQQDRPELATATLKVNSESNAYPFDELFLMFSAEFSDI